MIYLIIFLNRTFRRLFHLCFIVSNRIIQTYSITYIGASWLSNFGDSSSQLGKSRSECSTMFEQDEKEDADYAIEKQERQENEYKDPSYEAEEDEWGPQGVEQGQGDKFNETYMIKRDERKMEEEDISEDNMYDENGFDPDGYKKERHTVVQERQKERIRGICWRIRSRYN